LFKTKRTKIKEEDIDGLILHDQIV